ncbi:unnamed protein product [Ambrosiozyma monospora]|uniref:Unnamed protein product n=1 Tax=Ambrosiozyma monospora TaxID=43982 RepID=A0ACB5TQA1_AMBMO|nr:unnamed protein product [Ambrosiozyma monospora]
MSEVKIDAPLFRRRLHALQRNIASSDTFKQVNGLLVVVGSSDDSNPYQKSTILHTWLLGYEFPATAIYITAKKVVFLTSIGKTKYLNPLKAGNNNIVIHARNKDPEHNKKLFEEFIKDLKESTTDANKKIGYLMKDKYEGKFIKEWTPIFEKEIANSDAFELVDVPAGVSVSMEVKDEEEQKNVRVASRASTNMMTYFTDEMSKIIDED